MMVKKRTRIEVIQNILENIRAHKNSIRYTPLLRSSNVSSQRFSEYLTELLEKGFVKEMIDSQGISYLSLLDKGFLFLERYDTITQFITDFDL